MKPEFNGEDWTIAFDLPEWRDVLGESPDVRVEAVFQEEDDSRQSPPLPEQLAAVRKLVLDQGAVHAGVMEAVRTRYLAVRPKYVEFARNHPDFMGDPEKSMPPDPDPETFARLLDLTGIYVHSIIAKGAAYIGFGFHAVWDPEHGIGVMTHAGRVVEVGGADTAFLSWIAEADRDAP
jgi:hypothetical protein